MAVSCHHVTSLSDRCNLTRRVGARIVLVAELYERDLAATTPHWYGDMPITPSCGQSTGGLTCNQMVVDKRTNADADRIFHALADPTRRDILVQAGPGSEQSVSALARRYPMSVAAVQKHVNVLQNAGLVTKVRRGREQIVRVDTQALHTARLLLDQLEGLWRPRMVQFGQVLGEQTKGDV